MILDVEDLPPDLRGECFNVVYRDDMAIGIPEQINQNSDGSYTVFLNARYSYERWVHSMDHAFNHVREEDWQKHNVQHIESERHRRK